MRILTLFILDINSRFSQEGRNWLCSSAYPQVVKSIGNFPLKVNHESEYGPLNVWVIIHSASFRLIYCYLFTCWFRFFPYRQAELSAAYDVKMYRCSCLRISAITRHIGLFLLTRLWLAQLQRVQKYFVIKLEIRTIAKFSPHWTNVHFLILIFLCTHWTLG